VAKVGRPPEKTVFKRLSPAVVDARKQALQQYLQGVIAHAPNWPRLAAFLGSDIRAAPAAGKNVRARAAGAPGARGLTARPGRQGRASGQKEGFLSKRGRKLGVWKPRYFVFRGGTLKYYRTGKDVRPSHRGLGLPSVTRGSSSGRPFSSRAGRLGGASGGGGAQDGEPSGELSLESATVELLADNEAEAMRCACVRAADVVAERRPGTRSCWSTTACGTCTAPRTTLSATTGCACSACISR
jgi:hypothetical protein